MSINDFIILFKTYNYCSLYGQFIDIYKLDLILFETIILILFVN